MARRATEDEEKKNRWEDCSPDCPDCGMPSCDCDLPGCDLGFMMLSYLTLGRLLRHRPAPPVRPTRPPRTRPTVPGRAGMAAIRGYQRWLSPRIRAKCRHTPSCSAYGMEAVQRYGLLTGSQLTADRIRRCKAPTPHGTVDPVP